MDAAPARNSNGDRTRQRKTLEISWIIGVVAFVVARFALAYSALAEESRATVVVFGLLDLGTAVPYALGTARLVTSLVDRRPQAAARWGALASGSFLAPYLWIAWAGRDGTFPTVVYVVTVVFMVSLGANAVLGIRRRVRTEAAKAELAAQNEELARLGSPSVDERRPGIDLTAGVRSSDDDVTGDHSGVGPVPGDVPHDH